MAVWNFLLIFLNVTLTFFAPPTLYYSLTNYKYFQLEFGNIVESLHVLV